MGRHIRCGRSSLHGGVCVSFVAPRKAVLGGSFVCARYLKPPFWQGPRSGRPVGSRSWLAMGRRGRRLATEGSCGAASGGWGARSRLSGPEFRATSCSICSLGFYLDPLSTSHIAVHTYTMHDRAPLCLHRADQRSLQSLPTRFSCSSRMVPDACTFISMSSRPHAPASAWCAQEPAVST